MKGKCHFPKKLLAIWTKTFEKIRCASSRPRWPGTSVFTKSFITNEDPIPTQISADFSKFCFSGAAFQRFQSDKIKAIKAIRTASSPVLGRALLSHPASGPLRPSSCWQLLHRHLLRCLSRCCWPGRLRHLHFPQRCQTDGPVNC